MLSRAEVFEWSPYQGDVCATSSSGMIDFGLEGSARLFFFQRFRSDQFNVMDVGQDIKLHLHSTVDLYI